MAPPICHSFWCKLSLRRFVGTGWQECRGRCRTATIGSWDYKAVDGWRGIACQTFQLTSQGNFGRGAGKMDQMGTAGTVRTPETSGWPRGPADLGQRQCPLVLIRRGRAGIPDFLHYRVGSQPIDMPVRRRADPQMVGQPGCQTAGSEGPAHIGIATRPKPDGPKFSDRQSFF